MTTNSSVNKGPERISHTERAERHEKIHKKEQPSKEVKEANVGRAAVETVGFDESVETTTGKVSENLKDTAQEDKTGAAMVAKAIAGQYDPAQIKANLLRNIPSEEVMKKQVEKEIKKEIKYLHKKAIKMLGHPSGMSYFEMSNLVKKIRELKGILAAMAKAALDSLKTLWLRFVHGVM